ncbi:hypothetical protein BmR1_04g06100 [Babesia microti strain RI]|uniref:Transmembrane protein n=1 Tax=Babesia microti (strain RI) TaxID=1133968 RepID=A0A1N6LXN6_BABMR|nr:hypothetical protein BmR1_04g06100 [Babesia microti strain RI]SIO73622.1 hypothetical protein BmR1_04g06100 [Babesia microti strain RI]|eukprot:XP_012649826.2 hypothetical protein BmR1_04g06100 [Babesia microti strain RI]
MAFCNKLLVSVGRCMNVIVLLLGLCLYGVAGKVYSNVGLPLLSMTLGDIFCGTLAVIIAILNICTLKRRSKLGFLVSKSVGFVNIFMWFGLALAHYVTRNFKILHSTNPEEFQELMRVTLYGCLVGCATQIQVTIVSVLLTMISGNVDDIDQVEAAEDECSDIGSCEELDLQSTTRSIVAKSPKDIKTCEIV